MAAVDRFDLLYKEVVRSFGPCVEALTVVGGLYVAGKAFVLVKDCYSMVRVHFIPRILGQKLCEKYGRWAVIYGASEPLAKAYAEELAKQGINIILITQDQAAVADFVTSLSQTYAVETAVSQPNSALDQSACKSINDKLKNKDIGFLVNCMNESLASPQDLLEMPEQKLLEVVTTNITAVTLMARLVLPGMVERKRGAVVNISTGTCYRPLQGRVALTAFTGYLDHFSSALQHEYSGKGIVVQSLIPLQIASSPSSAAGWFTPRPEEYVKHAVSTLGIANRTTGYWPHALQYGLMKWIPGCIWACGSRTLISSS